MMQNSSSKLPSQNEQSQIEGKYNRKEIGEDRSEDDGHFGGGGFAENESGTEHADDARPPYTEDEFARLADIKYPEPNIQAVKSFRMYCSVVISQRRFGSKARGFVCAYSPVLSYYDIDQSTFLTFLESFHKASQVCHAILYFVMP